MDGMDDFFSEESLARSALLRAETQAVIAKKQAAQQSSGSSVGQVRDLGSPLTTAAPLQQQTQLAVQLLTPCKLSQGSKLRERFAKKLRAPPLQPASLSNPPW